ncbi:MAG TPA: fluoride efflux transporter CrcB [Burkholderiales bacterium]|nr:fluoride efflux transporter CrcB [Burkholderiales bacterium]
MTPLAAACVFIGGGLGAVLRWLLSLVMNPWFHIVPLGTLAVNLIGGYLVGVAAAFFAHHHDLPPEYKLFAITGILGGFTTFSAFSNEVVSLIAEGRPGWATATAAAHLFGSLLLTMLGIMTVRLFVQPMP